MTNSITKIKALKDAIGVTKSVSGTINSIVERVNHAWTHCGEPYPLPVGEYKRRAWLLADLERMLAQLVDEAHTEALEMDTLYYSVPAYVQEQNYFWGALDYAGRRNAVEKAHAEALGMDEQFDFYANPDWQRQLIAKAHNEAIQSNELIDASLIVISNDRGAWYSASLLFRKLVVAMAHTEASEENKRFDWLQNRWSLFHSSSCLQQEEIIAIAWEQARHITEAEVAYNTQKQRRLEAIWKHTHQDYKSDSDQVRSILVFRDGTTSVPLENLTDTEIEQRSYCWK